MRDTSIIEASERYGDATNGKGSPKMMPCHVEFSSMLDDRKLYKSNLSHSRSSSLSSSSSDPIDLLIEGMDIQDNYNVKETYSKEEDYISPYTCGKTFIIHKQSKDETLGIELGKATKYGGVFVTMIEPTSKFAYTGLKPGMQILSINDRPCPVDFRTVAYIMKQTVGDLKISAIDSTNKKVMAKAIQNRKKLRQQQTQQKQKQTQLQESSQLSSNSKKTKQEEGSTRSAKTWSPGSRYRNDQRETRESSQGSIGGEERCAPPTSHHKLPSPRTLASGGARLVSHWIRGRRYHKLKDSRRNSGRRLLRKFSSTGEERQDSEYGECSTDGLLKKIPSALALDDIVQEGLESTSNPTPKESFLLSDAKVSITWT